MTKKKKGRVKNTCLHILTRTLRCTDFFVAIAVTLLVLWSRYYPLLTCSWTTPDSNITGLLTFVHTLFFTPHELFIALTLVGIHTHTHTEIETKVIFIADPQLEGDAKIWRKGTAGRVEVALNDAYHRVVAGAVARLGATHAVLLGDLFSSERVNESEFAWRVRRFAWSFAPVLRAVPTINVTGNHDVGYGARITAAVLRRFERVYGAASAPHAVGSHVFCAVNSQALEGAPRALVDEAWARVDACAAAAAAARAPVVLLTHIPLHNNGPDGAPPACDRYAVRWTTARPRTIREQTHLTPATSARLLAALRPALVFAGHDHRGCAYRVVYSDSARDPAGVRTLVPQWTVRSVMGEHRGNVQLLAIGRRPGPDAGFDYAVSSCALGLKMVHYVWAAIALAVYLGLRLILAVSLCCFCYRRVSTKPKQMKID